jgi:hypothetical protein
MNNRLGTRARTLLYLALFIFLRPAGNLSLAWGHQAFSGKVIAESGRVSYCHAPSLRGLRHRHADPVVTDSHGPSQSRRLELHLPVTSIGYVLAALFGTVFLHETVTLQQWLGTILIFLGTGVVGSTSQNTTRP